MGLGNGDGAVISAFRAPVGPQHKGTVYVEGKSQVYHDNMAEQTRTGITVDTIGMASWSCPLQSDDHIWARGDILIDKKRLTVECCEGNRVRVCKLGHVVDKITVCELAGSVDTNGTFLAIVANGLIGKPVDGQPPDARAKYQYKDPLGEQLGEFTNPKLLVVDLRDMRVSVVDTKWLTPLKAVVTLQGTLYMTAVDTRLPRTNGIVYCSNKPVGLYPMVPMVPTGY